MRRCECGRGRAGEDIEGLVWVREYERWSCHQAVLIGAELDEARGVVAVARGVADRVDVRCRGRGHERCESREACAAVLFGDEDVEVILRERRGWRVSRPATMYAAKRM